MCTFIEDYLKCPATAVRNAQTANTNRFDNIDDEQVYAQISSGEFKLYLAMILSSADEDLALQKIRKRLSL